jgi:methylthioribose-1-phosphate isomerase
MSENITTGMPATVALNATEDALLILDQTRLPSEVVVLELRELDEIVDAIYRLKVRGAPAIGVAAALGAYVCALGINAETSEEFRAELNHIFDSIEAARPTAVNLTWAISKMRNTVILGLSQNPIEGQGLGSRVKPGMTDFSKSMVTDFRKSVLTALLAIAKKILADDIAMCRAIGEHGVSLLKPGMGILTHCNAGRLATAGIGTALAPIYVGHERGYDFKAYCDETRPLLQGARLTAWELSSAGVDTTLLCDNMAASLMASGKIDAIFVGCDRCAANGDIANKIGTLSLAINAKRYGIPFYVCFPSSTVDMNCPTGADIIIEQRAPEEVTEMWYEKRMAPDGVKVYNPAFDVTPNELITAIITEEGVKYAKDK